MAIERRRPNKQPEYLVEKDPVVGKWTGTYIGIVRRTEDPQRMGRLLVYIPQISPRDDENHWLTVNYASPFYGFTDPNYVFATPQKTSEVLPENKFDQVKHSYGMWFVPPDPGVKVLVTFVNGDANKGFWFACLPEGHSHHMVPGLGSSPYGSSDTSTGALPVTQKPDQVPVTEYNEKTANEINPNWVTTEKPLHQPQFDILRNQGLEFDYFRGSLRTSSQRQSPSTTFGISTPGRPSPDKFVTNPEALLSATERDVTPKFRKGGHTFVMDDGDILGNDNFFRIRSGGGHQILLHDTGQFIYICNSTGTVWIELDAKGGCNIFAQDNFNLRSASSINLHADKNINMYAGGTIQMVAEDQFKTHSKVMHVKTDDDIHLDAGGNLKFKSGRAYILESGAGGSMKSSGEMSLEGSRITLNSGGTISVPNLQPIARKKFPNSIKSGQQYKTIQNRITSIADRVPIHEPDPAHINLSPQSRPGATTITADQVADRDAGRVPAVNYGTGNYSPTRSPLTDNTKLPSSTKGGRNLKPYLDKQPIPKENIKGMTSDETRVYLAGLAVRESGFNYDIREATNGNYLGKYQMGAGALADAGYIDPKYVQMYGTRAVRYPQAWTGPKAVEQGIKSDTDFLGSPGAQEDAIVTYTNKNYDQLKRNGSILSSDDSSTVAGMLGTSHLLGAGGPPSARNPNGSGAWRVRWGDGTGADANQTTGKSYFDLNKRSIATLTKDGVIVS